MPEIYSHHDLYAVEASGLGNLDLRTEALTEVLDNHAVRCSEERKDDRDEGTLVRRQTLVPMEAIICQVYFSRAPNGLVRRLIRRPQLEEFLLTIEYTLQKSALTCGYRMGKRT